MASLYNDRLAFIHVPKTGGSWVTVALREAGVEFTEVGQDNYGHATWEDLPSDRFRFGFVRDKDAWFRSYWRHRQKHQDWPDPLPEFDRIAKESADFESFIRDLEVKQPAYLYHLYQRFLGPPGEIEFVGRYENLVDDLVEALDLSGVRYDEEALRSTPPVNTTQ